MVVTVESIDVVADITSARVTWVKPNSTPSAVYELQYFPTLFPSHVTTLNTTLKSHDVIGLIPTLRYQFQVRVYMDGERGEWVSANVSLEQKIRKYYKHV